MGGLSIWHYAIVFFTVDVYLLPTIIAAIRGHARLGGIAVVNLLLGWTLVGWVASLVWACWRSAK